MTHNQRIYARYDVPMSHPTADVNYQIARLFAEKRDNELQKMREENKRLRWLLAQKEGEEN